MAEQARRSSNVQVCCIEVFGNARGTGFLVAPDAVMTNYHVVADLLKGDPATKFQGVSASVFDYKAIERRSR